MQKLQCVCGSFDVIRTIYDADFSATTEFDGRVDNIYQRKSGTSQRFEDAIDIFMLGTVGCAECQSCGESLFYAWGRYERPDVVLKA